MVRKKIKGKKKDLGHKDWWDRNCTKKKREIKRMYRKWKEGKIGRERFIKEVFKKFLGRKQKEKRKEEENELRRMKREIEIWKYINKKRGKKAWIENKIGKDDWRKHFKDLLDGVEMDEEELREREVVNGETSG